MLSIPDFEQAIARATMQQDPSYRSLVGRLFGGGGSRPVANASAPSKDQVPGEKATADEVLAWYNGTIGVEYDVTFEWAIIQRIGRFWNGIIQISFDGEILWSFAEFNEKRLISNNRKMNIERLENVVRHHKELIAWLKTPGDVGPFRSKLYRGDADEVATVRFDNGNEYDVGVQLLKPSADNVLFASRPVFHAMVDSLDDNTTILEINNEALSVEDGEPSSGAYVMPGGEKLLKGRSAYIDLWIKGNERTGFHNKDIINALENIQQDKKTDAVARIRREYGDAVSALEVFDKGTLTTLQGFPRSGLDIRYFLLYKHAATIPFSELLEYGKKTHSPSGALNSLEIQALWLAIASSLEADK